MFNDLSLQYPSNEAWAIKKKDGMPKKHDPKKKKKNGHINVHEKREKIYIAMPSCYPNKGERDS